MAPTTYFLPLNGMNSVDPFIPLSSGYARVITNFLISNGKFRIRPACTVDESNSAFTGAVWHDTAFIIQADGDVYNAASGGLSFTLSNDAGTTTTPDGSVGTRHTVPTMADHGDLQFLCGFGVPRLASSPFTARFENVPSGAPGANLFGTNATNPKNITCCMSHQRRFWVAEGPSYECGEIDAVAGPMGVTPLSAKDTLIGIFKKDESIIRMFSVTVQPGDRSQNVAAFMGDKGSVVLYQGDYPGSETWQVIGKYVMPVPVGRAAFLELDGDVFVCSKEYIYSVRDLFLGAFETAYSKRLSAPIENIYQDVNWNIGTMEVSLPHAFYISAVDGVNIDAIFVQCYNKRSVPAVILTSDYDNDVLYFVYFRKYKAWAIWNMTDFFHPVRLVDVAVSYPTAIDLKGNIKTLKAAMVVDDTAEVGTPGRQTFPIEACVKWPWLSAFAGMVKRVSGARLYFRTSASPYIHRIQTLFDFTDSTNSYALPNDGNGGIGTTTPRRAVPAPALNLDANLDEQYITPMLGLAGEGSVLSLEVVMRQKDADSATQIQELYGATFYSEDGGVMS